MKHPIRVLTCAAVLALAGISSAFAEPVDVNHADAATLSSALKGIGPSKAAAIVAYRDQNGPFRSLEDLANVQGIGARTVEMNRDNILLGADGPK